MGHGQVPCHLAVPSDYVTEPENANRPIHRKVCLAPPPGAILAAMVTTNRLARWIPVFTWMALITYWSGQSDLPIDHGPIAQILRGTQHRFAHVAAYAVLAALIRWAGGSLPRASLWAWLLTAAFAATDELHQSFTPGRHPNVGDWLVDSATAAFVIPLVDLLIRRQAASRLAPRPVVARALLVGLLTVGVWLAIAPHAPSALAAGRRVARSVDRTVDGTPLAPVSDVMSRAVRSTVALARGVRSEVGGLRPG